MILRVTSMLSVAMLTANCSGLVPQSGWQINNENDAISGLSVMTAEQKLAGDAFDAEVVVSCKDLNHLEYKLTTFDKDGEPAPLRTLEDMNWGPYVSYQVRQDDKPARSARMTLMRYTNQVIFESKLGASGLGAARQVVVRLPLVGGEETYIIDQSDEGLHTVLDPCVTNQQRGIDDRQAARLQPEADTAPAETATTTSADEASAAPVAKYETAQNSTDDTDYQ